MKIVGFNLEKISAERKQEITGKTEIKQNINLGDIEKFKAPMGKDELARMEFTFLIDYSEKGKVEIKGHLILLPEKDELKKILKQQKSKNLPQGFKVGLINFIMSKCNIKALNVEDELGLPLHVPMPKLTPKQEE